MMTLEQAIAYALEIKPQPVAILPATQTVVVVSDGKGRTARMRVELIDTDLASADLAAVKVLVTNPKEVLWNRSLL